MRARWPAPHAPQGRPARRGAKYYEQIVKLMDPASTRPEVKEAREYARQIADGG